MTTLDIAHEHRDTAQTAPRARPSLVGLTRPLLMEALADFGLPEKQLRMRAGQVWNGIYNRGLTSFEGMTTLSKELRQGLEAAFDISRLEIVTEQKSVDGTRKWLLRLPSGVPIAAPGSTPSLPRDWRFIRSACTSWDGEARSRRRGSCKATIRHVSGRAGSRKKNVCEVFPANYK